MNDGRRKRLNELEGTFDIQGDEANFFDSGFPFAKIEDGRLMLYRPVSVERLDGDDFQGDIYIRLHRDWSLLKVKR